MELGSPPLYVVLNKATRTKDWTMLRKLGPYSRALVYCTAAAEKYRDAHDKIETGESIGGVDFNLAGIFLVWRGVLMKKEWIIPYVQ